MQNRLPNVNWRDKLWLRVGRLIGFRVEGNSMMPTLEDGIAVLIKPMAEFRIGDIVLATHPFKKSVKILKRIKKITPEGAYILVGDNLAESTDSRSFGAIQGENIIGKAICRLK